MKLIYGVLQQRNNLLQQSMLQNLRSVQDGNRMVSSRMPDINQLTSNVNRMTREMLNSVNTRQPMSVDTILNQQRQIHNQLLQGETSSPNSNSNLPRVQTVDRTRVQTVRNDQQPSVVVITRRNQATNNVPESTQTTSVTSDTSNPFTPSIGSTALEDIFTNIGGFSFPTTNADFWTGVSDQPTSPTSGTGTTGFDSSSPTGTTGDQTSGITFGTGFTSPSLTTGSGSQTSIASTRSISTNNEQNALTCTEEYQRLPGHTLCLTDSREVTRSGVTMEDKQLIVQMHNNLRASVQPPATDLIRLVWDDKLASVAQKWAQQCRLAHDDVRTIPELGMSVGQNVAVGYETWRPVLQAWYDEISLFKYGYPPMSYLGRDGWQKIGHFTQMVQNGTYMVGCGYAECPATEYVRYYVCNYAAGQSNLAYPYTAGSRCEACPNNCVDGLCDCGGLVCFNGGTLDPNSCKCECTKLYVGERCEILNCPVSDIWVCGRDWTPSYCGRYTNVPEECPYMCGICGASDRVQALTPGVSPTTTTTTRKSFTSAFGCRYTGIRDDQATCKAYGKDGSDSQFCASEGGTNFGCDECEIYSNIKKDYCPVMCGLCDPPCNGKRCSNGGTLNSDTCTCACRKPFDGDTCELAKCPVNGDPGFCSYWPKRYCQMYYNVPEECPYLCDICKPDNPEVQG